jgi:ABC-type sugar transport system ATPase subunit
VTSVASSKRTPVGEVVLEVSGVSKHFGGVQALSSVDMNLRDREILAIVGSNGAGKSTLVGILAGTYRPDTGQIRVDGRSCSIRSVSESRKLGIEVVFQDLGLVGNMDAPYNVFLGRPIRRFGFFANRAKMASHTRELLAQIHVSTVQDLRAPVSSMSGGQRQALAVGRAVKWRKRIVILDEPAAALGPEETEQVIALIQTLRDLGSAVIVISHNMEHVIRICDRVLVMRHGESIAQRETSELTTDTLIDLIMKGTV